MGFAIVTLYIIGLIIFFRVVADMFKRSVWLGVTGVIIFPITFIYVFSHLKGNRIATGGMLWFCCSAPYLSANYNLNDFEKKIFDFQISLESKVKRCLVENTFTYATDGKVFYMTCLWHEQSPSEADEAVLYHKQNVVQYALESFPETSTEFKLLLQFESISNSNLCFEISSKGEIAEQWISKYECEI